MQRLNFLFVIDPIETLIEGHDTTLEIMREADARGHTVWIATLFELRLEHNMPQGKLTQVIRKKTGWEKKTEIDQPLSRMDLIFMRKDPPFNIDYIMATSILSFVDRSKTIVMNDPDALRTFNEKLGIFDFPEYIPETIVTKSKADLIAFLGHQKKIVLKPLELNSGHEILILVKSDKNRDSLLDMMTKSQRRYIMAQRYLPEVRAGDKRVIILGGRVIGVVNRIAPSHDHRSNLHVGATAKPYTLTPSEKRMCDDIARRLFTKGISFAGLDLIGSFITEINITSPTGIVEINRLTGVHLEHEILDFFETAVARLHGSGTHRLARSSRTSR